MKKLALVTIMAGVVSACGHAGGGNPHEHLIFPGVRPASDDTAIAFANATCEVEDLNEERSRLLAQAYDMRHVVADHEYGRDTTLQTQVIELVNAFETDLNGAYTSVLTTCRSHAVCMHQNNYSQDFCTDTRDEWRASRDQFALLSADLADVRLRIAELCVDCGDRMDRFDHAGPRGGHHGPGPRPGPRPGHGGHGAGGGAVGSIFSSDPGRDPSPRPDRHGRGGRH